MNAFRLQPRALRQGFSAMFPFWLGAAPFAAAYAIAAHKAGLSAPEIQLMSLTVYSAAVQMSTVQLVSAGASVLTILATALAMNLHHILYGLSLAKQVTLSRPERATVAYFLTDSAYGITIAAGKYETFSFLLGAELSMFLVWNVFTAFGIVLGPLIVDPSAAHLDFIAPLAFFILLISTARTWLDFGVVVISTVATLVCLWMHLGNAAVLIVGISGAFLGTLIANHHKRQP